MCSVLAMLRKCATSVYEISERGGMSVTGVLSLLWCGGRLRGDVVLFWSFPEKKARLHLGDALPPSGCDMKRHRPLLVGEGRPLPRVRPDFVQLI